MWLYFPRLCDGPIMSGYTIFVQYMHADGAYEYPLTDKMLADYRQVKNTERRVAQRAAAQQAAAGQAPSSHVLTKRATTDQLRREGKLQRRLQLPVTAPTAEQMESMQQAVAEHRSEGVRGRAKPATKGPGSASQCTPSQHTTAGPSAPPPPNLAAQQLTLALRVASEPQQGNEQAIAHSVLLLSSLQPVQDPQQTAALIHLIFQLLSLLGEVSSRLGWLGRRLPNSCWLGRLIDDTTSLYNALSVAAVHMPESQLDMAQTQGPLPESL